jgi:hypothetical protein
MLKLSLVASAPSRAATSPSTCARTLTLALTLARTLTLPLACTRIRAPLPAAARRARHAAGTRRLFSRPRRFEMSRFITGRPTAAAGRHGATCCTYYPYVMRVVARVVVLLRLFSNPDPNTDPNPNLALNRRCSASSLLTLTLTLTLAP